MDLFLSKVLAQLVYPLGVSLGLCALSAILFRVQRTRPAMASLLASLAILWVSATPLVSEVLQASLERTFLPIPVAESPTADAIVVLGGSIGGVDYPRVEPEITDSSDRLLHAARLYRAGKAPIIIAAGGNLPWSGSSRPESTFVAQMLTEWGVPAGAIVEESASANTHQNASNVKRLLQERHVRHVLLVTSAMHMPRAIATFRTAGIDAVPSPTDYGVVDAGRLTILSFLPDAGALYGTTRALKEYLGLAVYWCRGWITTS
jgi:uncharacterized SAM-binding protein YcdF (DUF218 family)